jgi:hypothetical protein
VLTSALLAQDPGRKAARDESHWQDAAPRVFIDGWVTSRDYIRTEVPFVTYVRDRKDADVHILTTTQYGEAGNELKIEFIGLGKFQDIHFSLKYFSDRLATEDEERAGFVRILKKGLMPFLARTDLEDMLSVSFKEKARPAPLADPWNRWIFSLRLGGSASGEQLYKSRSLRASASANRVTESLKFLFSFSSNTNRYSYEDLGIATLTKNWQGGTLIVASLNDHWSLGGWLQSVSSTYANERYSYRIAPALEYDVFPYDQSTRQELRFLYRLSYGYNKYLEETVYDKLAEHLWSESLNVTLDLTQPWGSASASVIGSHYFHDLRLNRLTLYGSLYLRVWKGFSFNVSGDYELIRDQLSLGKAGLTDEEILLRLKQLRTTYSYYISAGISFSFGSVMSRSVNPRFGDSLFY